MMEDEYSDILDNRQFEVEDRANQLADGSEEVKIAVGFFYVSGFDLLRDNLQDAESVQLVIGRQTDSQTKKELVKGFQEDLDQVEKNEQSEKGVKRLYQLIQDDKVDVKVYTESRFHPKLYLFNYDDEKLPGSAIVGSSNLSPSGLTGNVELNVEKKDSSSVRYLNNWFDEIWEESQDFKEELLDVIESSKFNPPPPGPDTPEDLISPFKATKLYIYEQFNREIEDGILLEDIEGDYQEKLAEFQNDAVRSARYTLNKYNGVILSDSVGLGKTYIGAPLVQEYAHPQSKVLIIAPKRLQDMWRRMLDKEFPVNARKRFMSFAELSRLGPNQIQEARDFDIVLIDEAHRLRNSNTQRYDSIQNIGRKDKKYILLTATPIQNSVHDLDSIIKIFADDSDFDMDLLAKPSELFKEYHKLSSLEDLSSDQEARLDTVRGEIEKVMREVLISRTREYIIENYEDVTIGGREIKTPKRTPHLISASDSDMKQLYSEIIDKVAGKDSEEDGGLNLPYVGIGRYGNAEENDFELEYRNASALLVVLLFKRLESSLRAFEQSVDRLIEREKAMRKIAEGNIEKSRDRENILHYFDSMDDEGVLDDVDVDEVMDAVDQLGEDQRKQIVSDVGEDLVDLRDIKKIAQNYLKRQEKDAKVEELRELIQTDLEGEKVLIFTQYIPTAEYLFEELTGETTRNNTTGRVKGDGRRIGYVHGDNFDMDIVEQFSPNSQNVQTGLGEDEIDILIATDVLSVGQNLQDSRVVVNFDLHWNPMNMEQRIGRIDRITTEHDELLIYNFIPTKELEDSLGILERIRNKIEDISSTFGHEAPILEDTEELIDKNLIIYDKLEEGEFAEGDSFPSVTSKYDQFRNAVKEFCEENDITVEDLKQMRALADKSRIAFKPDTDTEDNTYLGLADLSFSSDREETKALVVKNERDFSQVEIGGQTAFFDIPKVEDDDLEIFNLIKSTETDKQVGDVEELREMQEVLESASNWNNQLLELDATPSDEMNKIKQYCESVKSDNRFSEDTQETAEEILELMEQYEVSDYYRNELYKIYKKRRRLGKEAVIDRIYEKLQGFELSEPEEVSDVDLQLTESLDQ